MTSALITFILIFLVFDGEKVRDFKKKKIVQSESLKSPSIIQLSGFILS